jgi:hypothetical protein
MENWGSEIRFYNLTPNKGIVEKNWLWGNAPHPAHFLLSLLGQLSENTADTDSDSTKCDKEPVWASRRSRSTAGWRAGWMKKLPQTIYSSAQVMIWE